MQQQLKRFYWLIMLVLLIIAYIFSNPQFISKFHTFFTRAGGLTTTIIFASIFLSINAIYIFFLWSLAKSSWKVKVIFVPLIAISTIGYLTYYLVDNHGMTFFTYLSLRSSASSIDDAFSAYYLSVIKAILITLPLLLLIIFHKKSPNTKKYSLKNITILFLLQILITSGVVYQRKNGTGADGLPPGTIAYAYETDILLNNALQKKGKDRSLPSHDGTPIFQNIVLIVDESILPEYINNKVTPTLYNLSNKIDLGIASAYSNCSQYSNILLRKLARYNHEVEDANSSLFIWDIMKHAGYTPTLIDAQGNGKNHNFFTANELINVNNIDTKGFKDDIATAKAINDTLNNGENNFIYVIKKGAHFPFSNQGIEQKFNPIMQSAILINEPLDNILNSYKNLISHNTDLFFNELNTSSPNTIFIYTSDHGQNLTNLTEKITHCSVDNAHPNEGTVPLILIGDIAENNIPKFTQEILKLKPSHYLIPYMLMDFAGYNTKQIKEVMNPPKNIESFTHGNILGFFGGKPNRTKIIDSSDK